MREGQGGWREEGRGEEERGEWGVGSGERERGERGERRGGEGRGERGKRLMRMREGQGAWRERRGGVV